MLGVGTLLRGAELVAEAPNIVAMGGNEGILGIRGIMGITVGKVCAMLPNERGSAICVVWKLRKKKNKKCDPQKTVYFPRGFRRSAKNVLFSKGQNGLANFCLFSKTAIFNYYF